MYNKIYFQFIFSFVLIFVLIQITSLYYFSSNIFSVFGSYHYVLVLFFAIFFDLGRNLKQSQLFLFILLYQTILVLGTFYFYLLHYENPLGFEPTDEVFYDFFGRSQRDNDLSTAISYLNANDLGISDYGFPIVIKFVYWFGGNEILNMKLFNIFVFFLSCIFLYKIVLMLSGDLFLSKLASLVFGLNPISVYFNSSGRKETLFVFVMIFCFYSIYKAIKERKVGYYAVAFFSVLLTGLFRTVFPIFVLLSFGLTYMVSIRGNYKFVRFLGYSFISIILLGLTYSFVSSAFDNEARVDRSALIAARLGRTPGVLDYLVMVVSAVIGPFPSFKYLTGNDSSLLQSIGNFFKIVVSFYFLIGCASVIANKMTQYLPMLFFILFNVILIVNVGASLDHRFIYPVIPFYFIIIVLGLERAFVQSKIGWFVLYLIFVSVLIISYNFR